MKSYLKVMPFSLWENNFQGWQQPSYVNKYHFLSFPYPTYHDPRFPDKVDINKINLYTGKIGRSKEDECKKGFKLISSKFYYRRSPEFAAIPRIKYNKQKITKSRPAIWSFNFLQPTHGSNTIFV